MESIAGWGSSLTLIDIQRKAEERAESTSSAVQWKEYLKEKRAMESHKAGLCRARLGYSV